MWVFANVNTSQSYSLIGWDLAQTKETEKLFIWYLLSVVSPEVVILTVYNAENEKKSTHHCKQKAGPACISEDHVWNLSITTT